jgi:hypothetical protein
MVEPRLGVALDVALTAWAGYKISVPGVNFEQIAKVICLLIN